MNDANDLNDVTDRPSPPEQATGSAPDGGKPTEPGSDADGGKTAGAESGADIPRWRRPAWQLPVVLAGAVLVLGAILAVVMSGDDDDDVIVDQGPVGGELPGNAALVAVTFGEPSVGTDPVDLTLRFVDADGDEIATRQWSEVEESAGGGDEVAAMGGLLQPVPAGDLRLEATLQQSGGPASCTQPFRTTQGDRLILRLEEGQLGGMSASAGGGGGGDDGSPCAPVQPVAEWVQGQTTLTGEPYVGLSVPEAEDRARSEGLTTRVVGIDGSYLVVTADLRADRLDLMVFDDTVVAAALPDDPPVTQPS